jgi:cation transport regulator ChaB
MSPDEGRLPAHAHGVAEQRNKPEGAAVPSEHQQAEEMRDDVPSTIARSDDKAVRTYKKTLESAEDSYGPGERAHRAAFSALKHTYEKVGDHWEPKDEPGPSDAQAEQKGSDSLKRPKETAEGVDANATKAHLLDVAKKLGVTGVSRMRKDELVDEIRKANARATRKARS